MISDASLQIPKQFAFGLTTVRRLGVVATFAVLLASLPARGQVTIPLQLINLGNVTSPEYKLGIFVGLGGGAPKLYEFDTGAAGFFPAYSANYTPWWGSFSSTGQNITMSYASGIQYNTTIVNTNVSLYASDGVGALPLASVSTGVAQIESATGSKVANWNTDLANGDAPLYGHFYGDFGMALYRNEGNTPVPPIPDPDTNPSVYPIIPQLGANTSLLGNGFILSMGNYSNPTPTLQIGLTPADRARFSITVAMNAPSGLTGNGVFPNGGGPTYSQQLINGNLTLDSLSQNVGVVLDTGAPSSELHTYGDITAPPSITNVTLTGNNTQSGLPATIMQYSAGPLQGFNNISTTTGTNPLFPAQGYLNSGLNIFFENDVMFDLENSVVGFAAPVPEPATTGLLAGFFATLALAGRRVLTRRIQK